jgi:hypothetical protein
MGGQGMDQEDANKDRERKTEVREKDGGEVRSWIEMHGRDRSCQMMRILVSFRVLEERVSGHLTLLHIQVMHYEKSSNAQRALLTRSRGWWMVEG